MKFMAVLIIFALGLIAFAILPIGSSPQITEDSPAPNEARRESTSPPAPLSTTPAKLVWKLEDLSWVRGIVISVDDDSIVVDCDQPRWDANIPNIRLGARDSGAGARSFIVSAQAEEKRKYGSTMMMQNGRLQKADFVPATEVGGTIRLRGYPLAQAKVGAGLKVAAAPLGGANYTMTYQLEAGTWMKDRRGSLDKK